jgi:hypothetical protein
MSNVREKQMLAKRNSSGWTSYEQAKNKQDDSLLNKLAENVGGPIISVIDGVGDVASKSASKVGEALRRVYHELTTHRQINNREQVIDEKVKGKK